MRVLHYIDENFLLWGAPWFQLLSALRDLGVEQAIACASDGTLADQAELAGFRVFKADCPMQWAPRLCRGLKETLKNFRPDLIHTRLSSAARIGGWWGRQFQIPVLATIDKYPKMKYYRHVDMAVGCSRAVSDHMIGIGFPEARLRTIHNPVDLRRYAAAEGSRLECRRQLGFDSARRLVLGMGRLVDWKAWDDYLRAIALLGEGCDDTLFLLVGSGNEEPNLKALAGELGLSDRLVFHPYVSDVRPWLWASDLFVQVSKAPEGFSLMLLEAMASSVPCVATAIGGSLDIVDDNVNGWLVPTCSPEAIARAIAGAFDVDLAAFGHRARLSAEAFGVEAIARRYYELYCYMVTQAV